MYVNEQFANPARIGVLSDHRERRTPLLATAAPPGRKHTPSPPENRTLGGRSFSSAITRRAEARHRSRWFTRAKYSLFSNCLSMSLLPHARAARYRVLSGHLPLAPGPGDEPVSRSPVWGRCRDARQCPWLPETVNRVETHLSNRKQTAAHRSTRDVPAHGKLRLSFAFSPRAGAAKSAYIGRADASKSIVLPCPKQ
jgi:hypothetical protein